MATHRLNNYDGGVMASDSANTAGAVVERDSQGAINVAQANVSQLVNTGGTFIGGTNKTTTVSLDGTTTFVKLNAAGGAFNATLPPAATSTNQVYVCIKTDSSANVPTLKGNGSELINGANTDATLTAQYGVVRLWCDGTQWWKW